MKRAIIALGIAMSFAAQADCIMRTTSLTKVVGKIDEIADIRGMATASSNQETKCSISARVQYKGQWHTVYGDYTGPTEVGDQELCVNAVEISVRQFLASKESKLMHVEQQMTCSDEEPIKTHSVNVGDVIRLSEVVPHPDKPSFINKNRVCRWFIEDSIKKNDTYLWQGVVCLQRGDDWIVVDKF